MKHESPRANRLQGNPGRHNGRSGLREQLPQRKISRSPIGFVNAGSYSSPIGRSARVLRPGGCMNRASHPRSQSAQRQDTDQTQLRGDSPKAWTLPENILPMYAYLLFLAWVPMEKLGIPLPAAPAPALSQGVFIHCVGRNLPEVVGRFANGSAREKLTACLPAPSQFLQLPCLPARLPSDKPGLPAFNRHRFAAWELLPGQARRP